MKANTSSAKRAIWATDIPAVAVSRAVARLEQSLGAQLFHRTTRAVSMTDTGRMLVDQFRRLIAERDEAIAMLAGERPTPHSSSS